ncbi:hypothetical protein BRADI_3g49725v3 [Brachypodium distachyon]|uniref:Uncharacterized protein n=1 Tax=Brachypodium distachyon TaxID=15368 RepID=A0A0Q3I3P1_BRADI|nr:hypothetical protein BRADI_3g49725v3 [Brachypodium distachyon]
MLQVWICLKIRYLDAVKTGAKKKEVYPKELVVEWNQSQSSTVLRHPLIDDDQETKWQGSKLEGKIKGRTRRNKNYINSKKDPYLCSYFTASLILGFVQRLH